MRRSRMRHPVVPLGSLTTALIAAVLAAAPTATAATAASAAAASTETLSGPGVSDSLVRSRAAQWQIGLAELGPVAVDDGWMRAQLEAPPIPVSTAR